MTETECYDSITNWVSQYEHIDSIDSFPRGPGQAILCQNLRFQFIYFITVKSAYADFSFAADYYFPNSPSFFFLRLFLFHFFLFLVNILI